MWSPSMSLLLDGVIDELFFQGEEHLPPPPLPPPPLSHQPSGEQAEEQTAGASQGTLISAARGSESGSAASEGEAVVPNSKAVLAEARLQLEMGF